MPENPCEDLHMRRAVTISANAIQHYGDSKEAATACTSICAPVNIDAHTHVHTHRHAHTHTHAYTRTHTTTHAHTRTHTRAHTLTHTLMHTRTHTFAYKSMRLCVYTHGHEHACIRTYTCRRRCLRSPWTATMTLPMSNPPHCPFVKRCLTTTTSGAPAATRCGCMHACACMFVHVRLPFQDLILGAPGATTYAVGLVNAMSAFVNPQPCVCM